GTLDVIRGVAEAEAAERITLYTGNDDHIVFDLITPFTVVAHGSARTLRIKGGLLGHWSVWVKRAVELLQHIHAAIAANEIHAELMALRAGHRLQRGDLRRGQRFPRRDRRLPRDPAPAGIARRHLVSR